MLKCSSYHCSVCGLLTLTVGRWLPTIVSWIHTYQLSSPIRGLEDNCWGPVWYVPKKNRFCNIDLTTLFSGISYPASLNHISLNFAARRPLFGPNPVGISAACALQCAYAGNNIAQNWIICIAHKRASNRLLSRDAVCKRGPSEPVTMCVSLMSQCHLTCLGKLVLGICSTCFYWLSQNRRFRRSLNTESTTTLVYTLSLCLV